MIAIRSDEELARLRRRARLVPLLTTLAGSLLVPVVPGVLQMAILPPLGLLTLLAWRQLRPELWPAWVALPLGLADDVLTGSALGTAPVLWTVSLLVVDEMDRRAPGRTYQLEWLLAAVLLLFNLAGASLLSAVTGGRADPLAIWPQWMVSTCCFPAVAWLVARCDRWRLGR